MRQKSFMDILHQESMETLSQAWDAVSAAEDFAPLPSGEYIARIMAGELFTSKTKGTVGYKLCFQVLEGEHQGRQFWHDIWLTPAALPMAKRDLGRIGVTSLEQLERPLPPGICCRVKLALRQADDGTAHNRVQTFKVIRVDPPNTNPFAPADPSGPGPKPLAAECSVGGD